MCINDWRLGRFVRATYQFILNPTDPQVVLPANNQRVGFNITQKSSGDIFNVAINNGNIVADIWCGSGIDAGFTASILQYGATVQHAITIRNITITSGISVTEWTLPEDYLAYAMQDWETGYSKWLDQHSRPMT